MLAMDDPLELQAELRRHNLLIPLLQRQVVAEAVADQLLTEEELNGARASYLATNNIENDDMLNKHLSRRTWNYDDFVWQISLPIKVQKHCHQEFRHKAEAHFLKRKNQLDRVVYSVLRVGDSLLANELYWRIESGEANFSDLAAKYAEGPERNTKGIIGPVQMAEAHPALAEALRTSKPGVLIKPFKIDSWFILARLETYKPASFDDDMAVKLSRELFNKWIDDEVARRIAKSDKTNVGRIAE